VILDLKKFIKKERPYWDELEKIIVDRNNKIRFSADRLKRFSYLYERASGDLVKMSTFSGESELRTYLESLVARAYSEIHSSGSRKLKFRPFYWLWVVYPSMFRRNINSFILCLAVFMTGALFGGIAVLTDSAAKDAMIPRQFGHLYQTPGQRVEAEENNHRQTSSRKLKAGAAPAFAAQLMVNNIKVSILALALGMTFGIGTVVVMFYNGIILGAVVTEFVAAGFGIFVTGWLLPHGAFEIPAVLIAGQAGFVLAGCMLKPAGARREAFRAKGADLITLIGGVAVMLVWAGIVEAFFSQYHEPDVPYGVKISFGVVQLLILIVWLSLGGRLWNKISGQEGSHERA
jgi:uncharacterized membrane protein SpoIIM required for sporulation